MRWLTDIKSGILDAEAYLKAYPKNNDAIRQRDEKRRIEQKLKGRNVDWDTPEVLENVCKRLDGRPHPKAILLDSGAFTGWNKGEATSVDDVLRKYSSFINMAGDQFDEIWGINLDVIPGERGRDPTPKELDDAVRVSDINFEILVKEFGDIILPVFHQGETPERLDECVGQVAGKSNYICVSPRNDLAETLRVKWSRDCHGILTDKYPDIMTHGLATTGNRMVRTVPWYSGDSAAWVQHGGFGMIDIFHEQEMSAGRKNNPHYMNYFTSLEGTEFDLGLPFLQKDGTRKSAIDLGFNPSDYGVSKPFPGDVLLPYVDSPDHLPLIGAHTNDKSKHYLTLSDEHQTFVRQRVEALGFPFEMAVWDSRVRNLICMAEFVAFAEWAESAEPDPAQMFLFGGL